MNTLYWALIAVLGIVHLQSLLINLPFAVPIYLTCLFTACIVYFLCKKTSPNVSILGIKQNGFLFIIQIVISFIYTAAKPSWIYFVPIVVFIGLECIRISWAKQITLLTKRVNDFAEQNNHINETFRLVRSERHDFLKHVSALHYLLENKKNNEAKAYLDDLVDGYEETNLSIKGERGVVAGILHKMHSKAKTAGIAVAYDFDLPLSSLPLSDQQMAAFIGNLLSNSIEACEDWKQQKTEQPYITMQFYKRSGLYLLICKNKSLPIPREILDDLYKKYGNTTKIGEHKGLGTKIIHDIVKDHQGLLDFIYKDHEFTVKIKIPAIID